MFVLVLVSAGLVPAVGASAAAAPLPSDMRFTVTGGGWGHGHGMSQYGARAQAEDGRTWQQILHSYYTGVGIADRGQIAIRVLLNSATEMSVGGPETYAAKWTTGATILASSSAYPFMNVRTTSSVLSLYKGASATGPWVHVTNGPGPIRFIPSGAVMPVVRPSGGLHYYRGFIEAFRRSSSSLYTINHLTMEQYLYGVVPREMPSSWHAQALRAQAVAARSYSAWKRGNAGSGASYHICATDACQVYSGYGYRTTPSGAMTVLEAQRSNQAVDATTGSTMVYQGAPVFAEFNSSSGGYTAQGSRSYLAPVPDPWDQRYSPYYRWSSSITVAQIQSHWPAVGQLTGISRIDRDGYGPWGGRVNSMTLNGTSRDVTVSGNSFRSAFQPGSSGRGVRSTLFTISIYDARSTRSVGEVVVAPGGTTTVTLTVRNVGGARWPLGRTVALGTWSPQDRVSPFKNASWISGARPSWVTANRTHPQATSVAPDEVGEFRFTIAAPLTQTPGTYTEVFRPVASSTWFGNSITVPVRVGFDGASHLGGNLAKNPSFEATSGRAVSNWRAQGMSGARDRRIAIDGVASARLTGDPSGHRAYTQTVAIAGARGARFVLSGWSRAVRTSASGGPITMTARALYTDGTAGMFTVSYRPRPHAWTYGERSFVLAKPVRHIVLSAGATNQSGTMWFDRIRLARDDLLNGGFEVGSQSPASWTLTRAGAPDGRDVLRARAGRASLVLTGRRHSTVLASQIVASQGATGNRWRLSGWNRSSRSAASGGMIALVARLVYTDGSTAQAKIDFPRGPHGWGFGETTLAATKPVRRVDVSARAVNQTGRTWFDELTLARAVPTEPMSANPGFEVGTPAPGDWTVAYPASAGVQFAGSPAGGASLHIAGDQTKNEYARQVVPLAGLAGDTFRLTGWSKTTGTDPIGGPVWIWARIRYIGGESSDEVVSFSELPHDWQSAARTFTTTKPYAGIEVFARFAQQTGDAWFDGIVLERVP